MKPILVVILSNVICAEMLIYSNYYRIVKWRWQKKVAIISNNL